MLDSEMFFSNWAALVRPILVGGLAYVALILMLRLSGKRTLAKMNSFDLIVTVALGSTLATVLLSKEVALAEGVTALGLLILLQFIVTWSSVRIKWVRGLARSEPRMLLYRGEFLTEGMKAERVTQSEVLQAVRSQGILAMDEVDGVVLETDGTFSVIVGGRQTDRSSLVDVRPVHPHPENRS